LKRNYPGGTYHSVYEAGFCGFSIHRQLIRLGIDNIVINPADVPTKNKERRRKTDKVDSRKLARELESGSLEAIYIPTLKQQDLRSLCRLRKKLTDHQTRLKNRIKGLLYYRGVKLPGHRELPRWSNNFLLYLEDYASRGNNPGMDCLRISLDELRQQRSRILKCIRLLRKYTAGDPVVQNLLSIPGIGFTTAVTLYSEIMDMRRFHTLNEVCAYVGLVPDCHSSGENEYTGEMTSLGNRYLRFILTEAVWIAVRKDPAMLQSFSEMCKTKKKHKAIIKIARKLLNRIRFVWNNQTNYQCSIKAA
jgi:transposase